MKINGEEFCFSDTDSTHRDCYRAFAQTVVDISFAKDGVGVNVVFTADELSALYTDFGRDRVGAQLHELISEAVLVNPRQKLYSHFSPHICTLRTFTTHVRVNKKRISKRKSSHRKK